MNLSIGGKIFGITLCLLALTALVSIISSGLVSRGRAQLLVVSEGFVPLKDAVSDFRFRMLERQMHLARARALLARTPYREEELARERALLGQKDAEAAAALEHAARAELLLESAPLGGRGKVEMAKFSVLLAGLQTRSRESSGYSTRLLDAMTVHDSQAIAALTPLVEKTYAETMSDSEKGLADVSEFNRLCTEEVLDMQQRIQRVSFTATGIACLVGLVLSILVIRGLMRSVRALMTGVHAVESGKLDVEVQVATADEIAELARSFNKMVQELRVKDRIKDTFGKYVDPRIVADLVERTASQAEEGRRETMSVFFSDLVGFTGISERLTPSGLVRVMNRYLSLMSEPIHGRQGVIDKYIGDAIMAFWGPPFTPAEQHAGLACLAALAQLQALEKFRAILPELMGLRKGVPDIDFRIGIATGDVVVGSIGSEVSKAFTVLGDTVNLASRLEGANKQYGTRILLSEETEKMARAEIETREIDLIAVKGKTDPVRVFELLGRHGELDAARQELRRTFEEGLSAYRARRWNDGIEVFKRCLGLFPGDRPSAVYLSRCERLATDPPAQDWDGVWRLSEK